VTERRAQQERELAGRLDEDGKWRRGRLRDVVSASELTNEWIDQVTRSMLARGTDIGQVVRRDQAQMRAFADGMPSSRVAISLKTRYHRDGRHQWTPNDIHDIDALAIAMPTATPSLPTRRHATRSMRRESSGPSAHSFPASPAS
jgi:hypothetical protein